MHFLCKSCDIPKIFESDNFSIQKKYRTILTVIIRIGKYTDVFYNSCFERMSSRTIFCAESCRFHAVFVNFGKCAGSKNFPYTLQIKLSEANLPLKKATKYS